MERVSDAGTADVIVSISSWSGIGKFRRCFLERREVRSIIFVSVPKSPACG
jgi:hypothetical protein